MQPLYISVLQRTSNIVDNESLSARRGWHRGSRNVEETASWVTAGSQGAELETGERQ
jgi:hypothetical protein